MSTYRPGEAASMLGVASATLRRYSVQFSEYLSPGASAAVAQGGGALERRYSESDIALLRRASGLLERGLTFDQVKAQLAQGAQSAPEHALSIAPDTGMMLLELVSRSGETIAAQRQTIDLQQAELERSRAELDQAQREMVQLRERVQLLERLKQGYADAVRKARNQAK